MTWKISIVLPVNPVIDKGNIAQSSSSTNGYTALNMFRLLKAIFFVFFNIWLHNAQVAETTLAETLIKHKNTVHTSTIPKIDYQTDLSNIHKELKVRMQKAQHLNHSKIEDDVGLDDIFIAVKTTSKNSNTRLSLILKTWFQLAKKQVMCLPYFFYLYIKKNWWWPHFCRKVWYALEED